MEPTHLQHRAKNTSILDCVQMEVTRYDQTQNIMLSMLTVNSMKLKASP